MKFQNWGKVEEEYLYPAISKLKQLFCPKKGEKTARVRNSKQG
jgi:hypothetical protein